MKHNLKTKQKNTKNGEKNAMRKNSEYSQQEKEKSLWDILLMLLMNQFRIMKALGLEPKSLQEYMDIIKKSI